MSEPVPAQPVRQPLFDRIRMPVMLLTVAFVIGGVYYFFFEKQKTDYYTNRDARLIARAADQIQRSIGVVDRIVGSLAATGTRYHDAYTIHPNVPEELRSPSAIFTTLDTEVCAPDSRRMGQRNGKVELAITQRTASATIELEQLLKPVLAQLAGVFDTLLIVDASGDVLYQSKRADVDAESDAQLKIVRLQELTAESLLEKPQTLKIADLTTTSRQMPVRLGDGIYQFFSVPIRAGVTDANGRSNDRSGGWIVCGLVSSSNFRAKSLAVSSVGLSCIAGVVLLLILSWPFLKIALMSAQHKLAIADVMFLGFCGILIVSVVCLAAVDALVWLHLGADANEQLVRLSDTIDARFNDEIRAAGEMLDVAVRWKDKPAEPNTNLFALEGGHDFDRHPFFQAFTFLDRDGNQAKKWFVDDAITPLVPVGWRSYFTAPMYRTRDYARAGSNLMVDSFRSVTTGQPEIAVSKRTEDTALPVIALSLPTALSVLHTVLPEGFRFAIIEPSGKVILHSDSERNTSENLFAETDDDRRFRSVIDSRQHETLPVRYQGEDYVAHVHPMQHRPWTIVTLREESGLRAVNAQAVLTTLYFVLALNGLLLLLMLLVHVLRPRYRAAWAWPDRRRVQDYRDLVFVHLLLLVAGSCLVASLSYGALFLLPFGFVPFVLIVTYLHVMRGKGDVLLVKRGLFSALAAGAFLFLFAVIWGSRIDTSALPVVGRILATILLCYTGVHSALRTSCEREAKARSALMLAYLPAAALLLLLTSAIPTVAFFRGAARVEISAYVKWVQMKLARDLHDRWWRVSSEFSKRRGEGKDALLDRRWYAPADVYADVAYGTHVCLRCRPLPAAALDGDPDQSKLTVPAILSAVLPHYSSAALNTRELIQDHTADERWEWSRTGSQLEFFMRDPADRHLQYTISSTVPSLLPASGIVWNAVAIAAVLLLLAAIAFGIALFVARRVFIIDFHTPLALASESAGLRHMICYAPDDEAAKLTSRAGSFVRIDLGDPAAVDRLRNAAPPEVRTIFIDRLDDAFAEGLGVDVLRVALERFVRNAKLTIVLRPLTLDVIADVLYEREDGEAWKKLLSKFKYVDTDQIARNIGASRRIDSSDSHQASVAAPAKLPWWKVVDFEDSPSAGREAFADEVASDPYLACLVEGLLERKPGREQVFDEIGERAESYYGALWDTCSDGEKLVMMQLAKTGLVNAKMRRDVRGLFARGLLYRMPQLRLMNETFRRFVLAKFQSAAGLAKQIEENLAADAWTRLRLPLAGLVMVILLFFFMTQRELFDATFAVVTGLVTGLPAFLRLLSGVVERKAA